MNENECGVCENHEEAYKKLEKQLKCGNCGKELELPLIVEEKDFCAIGIDNSGGSQPIKLLPTIICDCGQLYALDLVPVIWNANHDIYYTGSGIYLPFNAHGVENVKKNILSKIKGWKDRIQSGDTIDEWNLAQWLTYEVEGQIAKYIPHFGWRKKD